MTLKRFVTFCSICPSSSNLFNHLRIVLISMPVHSDNRGSEVANEPRGINSPMKYPSFQFAFTRMNSHNAIA